MMSKFNLLFFFMAILGTVTLDSLPSISGDLSFDRFAVSKIYRGKTVLPQFDGRDKEFKEFRTRIRNGMKGGPNFSGSFSIIQFGCGTGCTFTYITNNRTGQVYKFPRGGDDYMYVELRFVPESSLLIAQSANTNSGECLLEYFDWTGSSVKKLDSRKIGNTEACNDSIEQHLAPEKQSAEASNPAASQGDTQIVFTEGFVKIPRDDILFGLEDSFDIVSFRSKFEGHPNYKINLDTMPEDDIGDFITISDQSGDLLTVFGDLSNKRVRFIHSESKNAFSPNGAKVGDNLVDKVGKNLVCIVDRDSYCEDPHTSNLQYIPTGSSDCKAPSSMDDKHFNLGNCERIESIDLQNPNFFQ